MIKMLEPGTKDTSCPMMLAMYVFPCRRETAAEIKRYFGSLTALIIAICEGNGVTFNNSMYGAIGSLRNLASDPNSTISSEIISLRLTSTAIY